MALLALENRELAIPPIVSTLLVVMFLSCAVLALQDVPIMCLLGLAHCMSVPAVIEDSGQMDLKKLLLPAERSPSQKSLRSRLSGSDEPWRCDDV